MPSASRNGSVIRGFRPRYELAQPRILPSAEYIQVVHGIGALAQAGSDCVKAEQRAGGGH